MIVLNHSNTTANTAIVDEQVIELPCSNTLDQLFHLASIYPGQWIGWVDASIETVDWSELKNNINNNYSIVTKGRLPSFLKPDIGYVEDSPFINCFTSRRYPTWLMSPDIGMIHASVLNAISFRNKSVSDFGYDLNLLSRSLQQQGILCYFISVSDSNHEYNSNDDQLYKFVSQSMKRRWTIILLLCHALFEKRFPLIPFLRAQFSVKSDIKIDIKALYEQNLKQKAQDFSYDVIIPTIGRYKYLKDVLIDLNNQEILPEKVIIIEQNPEQNAQTELDYIFNEDWKFEIGHEFTHITGACRARNRAIKLTNAPYVLLFDDDVRVKSNFISITKTLIEKTKAQCITFSCLQKGELETVNNLKQWKSFGSGCSIVHKDIISQCTFDIALEHGYGEDVDYGMQIRNAGYDVIYAPQIQMLHLKAPVGGFRKKHQFPWSDDTIQPKPSPQIMYHRKKNYTIEQLKGYKLILFLKFYKQSGIKNPYTYFKYFKKAWNTSVTYASALERNSL